MEQMDELLKAPVHELVRGYAYQESTDSYLCLVCGQTFEKGVIFKSGEQYYEAEKFAKLHLSEEHGSMFDYLLGLNKKLTGLTDLQKNLLRLFYDGHSDNDIVKQLDGGSASTIRNHRFALREKEKQAKLFLAIMELLEQKLEKKGSDKQQDKTVKKQQLVDIHRTATMRDERYATTEEEYHNTVMSYFKEGMDGPLSHFPKKKEKRKIVILRHLMSRFQVGIRYTEKQVNAVLQEAYHDYVTLRRYLIEYGFMDREEDGSAYWVKEGIPEMSAERRKELLEAFKDKKYKSGVYQVRNLENGKLLLGSGQNLDAVWNRIQFELNQKSHRNKQLQRDWTELGESAFVFEILEEMKPDTGRETAEITKVLAEMEARWTDKLQPFGDQGYNG